MNHDVENVDYLEISEEKSATLMGEKLGHQNPLEKSASYLYGAQGIPPPWANIASLSCLMAQDRAK